jgi:hypothetical protein
MFPLNQSPHTSASDTLEQWQVRKNAPSASMAEGDLQDRDAVPNTGNYESLIRRRINLSPEAAGMLKFDHLT